MVLAYLWPDFPGERCGSHLLWYVGVLISATSPCFTVVAALALTTRPVAPPKQRLELHHAVVGLASGDSVASYRRLNGSTDRVFHSRSAILPSKLPYIGEIVRF